nr:hypothetical protein [Chryseolinea sp.]
MHYFIGNLGHIFVITSFIAALLTVFNYFKATTTEDLEKKNGWLVNGKASFYVHAFSVFGICV